MSDRTIRSYQQLNPFHGISFRISYPVFQILVQLQQSTRVEKIGYQVCDLIPDQSCPHLKSAHLFQPDKTLCITSMQRGLMPGRTCFLTQTTPESRFHPAQSSPDARLMCGIPSYDQFPEHDSRMLPRHLERSHRSTVLRQLHRWHR